jgi:HxlR-like helix-turn-helix
MEHRLLCSKWAFPILLELQIGPQRLSTLCRRLPNASKKIIIETLSGLVRAELIQRIEYEGKIKHVEYQLTDRVALPSDACLLHSSPGRSKFLKTCWVLTRLGCTQEQIFERSDGNSGMTRDHNSATLIAGDSGHQRTQVGNASERTRISCSNGIRLQGGVKLPAGGRASERLHMQGQQIWCNSRADGIVRMSPDLEFEYGTRKLCRKIGHVVTTLYQPLPGEAIVEDAPRFQWVQTPSDPALAMDFWSGYWPGHSAKATTPAEHLRQIKPTKPCWCGRHKMYGECHRNSDAVLAGEAR